MKKKYAEDDSENEFSVDEPEELQESDDDWVPTAAESTGRRQSRRARTVAKKPRLADPASSEEEAEDEEEDGDEDDESIPESDDDFNDKGKKRRGRGGSNASKSSRGQAKRAAISSMTSSSTLNKEKIDDVTSTTTTENTLPIPVEKEFTSGAFVVLKSDFINQKDPPIWKIDGKALLQKYMPFEQDGKTLYKNTSTYSGWSTSRKDDFYPAPISFKLQNRKETIIEFLRDQIVVEESD